MHHALRIYEIVLEIMEECSPSTCANAACVCTSWTNPALDVLWRTLPQPWRIFGIFGVNSSSYNKLARGRLRRRVKNAWPRFTTLYAPKIRMIGFLSDGLSCQDRMKILQFIVSNRPLKGRPGPIFPHVGELNIRVDSEEALVLAFALLSPTVRRLAIESPIQSAHLLIHLPHDLAISCPNLIDLMYYPSSVPGQVEDEGSTCRMISKLPCLKRFVTNCKVTLPMLEQLASRPRLESIAWFDGVSWFGDFGLPRGFTALREMDGSFMDLDSPIAFLKDCTSECNLENLSIRALDLVNHNSYPIGDRMWNLIDAASRHARTLRNFRLGVAPQQPHRIPSFDSLQLLARCTLLIEIKIQYNWRMKLQDEELEAVVSPMGELKRFTLIPDVVELADVPTLTLKCLKGMAKHCRSLEFICIYLDGRQTSKLSRMMRNEKALEDGRLTPLWIDEVDDTLEYVNICPLGHLSQLDFGLSPINRADFRLIADFLQSLSLITSEWYINWVHAETPMTSLAEEANDRKAVWGDVLWQASHMPGWDDMIGGRWWHHNISDFDEDESQFDVDDLDDLGEVEEVDEVDFTYTE